MLDAYPRDPRSHLYRAVALVERDELAGAERELRTALAEAEALRAVLAASLKTYLEGYLSLVLHDQNKIAEARAMAASSCASSSAALHANVTHAKLRSDANG